MTKDISFDGFAFLYGAAPDDLRQAALAAAIRVLEGGRASSRDAGAALTITRTAERAGVSRPTVYRALAAGALSSFIPYPGSRPRITELELANWMAGRGVK